MQTTLSPAPNNPPQSNKDNIYVCAHGINSGKYVYNNLQRYDATWYHKVSATWNRVTEAWCMCKCDVPNVAGNVANPVPIETGANGAYCKAGSLRCTTPEYAVMNYADPIYKF